MTQNPPRMSGDDLAVWMDAHAMTQRAVSSLTGVTDRQVRTWLVDGCPVYLPQLLRVKGLPYPVCSLMVEPRKRGPKPGVRKPPTAYRFTVDVGIGVKLNAMSRLQGEELAMLLAKRGLTVPRFAQDIGYTPRQVTGWLGTNRAPKELRWMFAALYGPPWPM